MSCNLLLMNGMYELMEYNIKPIVISKKKYKKYTDFDFIKKYLSNDSLCKLIKYIFTHTEFRHYKHFHKPTAERLRYVWDRTDRFNKYVYNVMNDIVPCVYDNFKLNAIKYNRPMWNTIQNSLVLFEDCCGYKKVGIIVGNNGRYGNNITLFRILLEEFSRKNNKDKIVFNIQISRTYGCSFDSCDINEIVVPTNKIITNIWSVSENGDYYIPSYRNFDEPFDVRISQQPVDRMLANNYRNPYGCPYYKLQ